MKSDNSITTRTRLVPAGLALLLVTLAGCESTKLAETARSVPVESRQPLASSADQSGAAGTTAGTPQSRVATVDLANRPAGGTVAGAAASMALPSQKIVYFDYDSFVIKDDFKPVVDGYGRALSNQRAKKLVIEGHTDERGGREYNLALGQKRAEAVARSIKLLGASDGQVEAVSFGEERPAAQGGDESAWAKNRRAELKDR